jgi:TonB family protein
MTRFLVPLIGSACLLLPGCSDGNAPAAPSSGAVSGGAKKSYFVKVGFTVQADGSITDVEVLSTDATQRLQEAALEHVRRFRAKPGMVERSAQMVVFTLNG